MRTSAFNPWILLREDGHVTIDWSGSYQNSCDQAGNDVPCPQDQFGNEAGEVAVMDAITGGVSSAEALRTLADMVEKSELRDSKDYVIGHRSNNAKWWTVDEIGWVDFGTATRFTGIEVETFPLLPEGYWVQVS